MFDKFSRFIDYMRVSVTDRCNLRCTYCMPEQGVIPKRHMDILSYEKIIKVVKAAVELDIKKIRLTGGEPLVRKGILYLVEELKQIHGINEIAMTTNGVLLKQFSQSLKDAGIHRLNISLDTLNPQKYKRLTRIGDIKNVLNGIDTALEAGFENIKVNMVLIPGFNDDEVEKMQEFCQQKGLLLQRINHYSLEDIKSIDQSYTAERPLKCESCNRIRLTADGKLKPCLFSNVEIPLNFKNLHKSLIHAIQCKPDRGSVNGSRQNWQIGG